MTRSLVLAVSLALSAGAASAADRAPLDTGRFDRGVTAETPALPDAILIESEAQFAADYGDMIEKIAPGVYLFQSGQYAGKVVAIGEQGLAHDLALHRARVKHLEAQGEPVGISADIVRDLEKMQRTLQDGRATMQPTLAKKLAALSLFCSDYYYDWRTNSYRHAYWTGSAVVTATTELYADNGGGGWNPYYARATSSANAHSIRPFGVPYGGPDTYVCARAENKLDGTKHEACGPFGGASAGPVYSGPVFSHDLYAYAYAGGIGDCRGFASISDEMKGVKFPSK